MAFCPSACATIDLIGNPAGGCDFATRKLTINRLAFFNCNLDIPDPMDITSIPPLFTGGDIVVSSPLRNVNWSDPEFEDLQIHDCVPPSRVLTKRQLAFEDVIAVASPAVTGPPPVPANDYADYDFWKDKKVHRLLLRYGFVGCNGDFWFARNPDGTMMEGWFDIYISGQRLGNAGGTIEIKKGTIDFAGDPLDFYPPDFNLVEFGIDV